MRIMAVNAAVMTRVSIMITVQFIVSAKLRLFFGNLARQRHPETGATGLQNDIQKGK